MPVDESITVQNIQEARDALHILSKAQARFVSGLVSLQRAAQSGREIQVGKALTRLEILGYEWFTAKQNAEKEVRDFSDTFS